VVPGHELAGVVTAVGKNVTNYKVYKEYTGTGIDEIVNYNRYTRRVGKKFRHNFVKL
jgi:NADPH:quinone reductase-like Zn-dependent oxidoreductase